MADPRILQGSPLTEAPLAWHKKRSDVSESDLQRARARAAEVAPGVFISCLGWGTFIMPSGVFSSGAQIAVWDERTPATPAEAFRAAQERTCAPGLDQLWALAAEPTELGQITRKELIGAIIMAASPHLGATP